MVGIRGVPPYVFDAPVHVHCCVSLVPQDDDKLLADVSLSRESRQAVLLRRCEKAILNLARETAVERSRTLQTSLPKV